MAGLGHVSLALPPHHPSPATEAMTTFSIPIADLPRGAYTVVVRVQSNTVNTKATVRWRTA